MPTQKQLTYFREGLRVLHRAKNFSTLQDAIQKMLAVVSPDELDWAKDAIARVLRNKQALEVKESQGYPDAINELDQKYKDLYLVLKSVQTPMSEKQFINSSTNSVNLDQPTTNSRVGAWPLAKLNPLSGFEASLMLLEWLKSKKSLILAGTAVASTAGMVLWLYRHFNPPSKDEDADKESNFERTIKSIQRYKVFTQLSNDPNFSGNYQDLLNLNPNDVKKKNVKKKNELYDKSLEWESEERSLMKEMDGAFNILSNRPRIKYELPQLPEPKNIDPLSVVNEFEEEKKQKKSVKKVNKFKTKPEDIKINSASEYKIEAPKKPVKSKVNSFQKNEHKAVRKPKKNLFSKKNEPQAAGRLIPVVKRTRRVKKVKT